MFFFLFLLRPFLLQSYQVISGSMERNLLIGDFLLVNKAAYGGKSPHDIPFSDIELPSFRLPGYTQPRRGDILVFEFPLNPAETYVKRCVAVGGDTVEMRDKVLYVNGLRQEEPFARHIDPNIRRSDNRSFNSREFDWQKEFAAWTGNLEGGKGQSTRDNFAPLLVPAGKYFCLGDNRDNSSDSRYWGFVDRDLIKGRPLLMYFSWDKQHLTPRFDRIGRIVR